jgi:hypothetical protein
MTAGEMEACAIQAFKPLGHMAEQTRHYNARHKVVAIHKSIGGTRGPRDTTAKSLVARGPREVPVELWIARRGNNTAIFYRPESDRMIKGGRNALRRAMPAGLGLVALQ